tara:strand:+ start:12 stop:557 length:546 start_codon:yes stop_codon:yes gene_type:complete
MYSDKNTIKSLSKKEQQLNFLKTNSDVDTSVKFTNFSNISNISKTPTYLISTLTLPIIYYFSIKKYTDIILQDSNCNCVLKKNITDIKQKSIYLIGFQLFFVILQFFKIPFLISVICSIISIFLLISVFSNWRKITKNIDENKCECANTSLKTIISFIAWTQIILLAIGPVSILIFLILRN